jgi:hypothetical protein
LFFVVKFAILYINEGDKYFTCICPRTVCFDNGQSYLLHSFQGLKRLTLFIIETYQLFLISYIFYRLCGFTNRYLIHLFQGLKCLTLPIIETYSPWTYTCKVFVTFVNIQYSKFFTTRRSSMAKREPGPNTLFALILVRPDNYNYVGY